MAGISKSCLCFIILIFISHVMVLARNGQPYFRRPIGEPGGRRRCGIISPCRRPPHDMAKKGYAGDTTAKKNAVKIEGRGGYNNVNP